MSKQRVYDNIFAGDLDERITVQKRTNDTHTQGEDSYSWDDTTYEVYAKIEEAGGGEEFEINRETASTSLRFTIRNDSRFTPKAVDRIVYDGDDYDILHVRKMRYNVGYVILARVKDS